VTHRGVLEAIQQLQSRGNFALDLEIEVRLYVWKWLPCTLDPSGFMFALTTVTLYEYINSINRNTIISALSIYLRI
jgi:hypothetical protein